MKQVFMKYHNYSGPKLLGIQSHAMIFPLTIYLSNSMTSFWFIYCQLWTSLTEGSGVLLAEFELVYGS